MPHTAADFPVITGIFRGRAFLSVLWEFTGKITGKSIWRNGNFAGASREYRERVGVEVIGPLCSGICLIQPVGRGLCP